MSQNLISATISAADVLEVQKSLSAAKAKLPFLSNLQPEDLAGLLKVGNNFLPFLEDAYQVVITHPEILPASFNKDEFLRDYALLKAIRPLLDQINELAEGLQKTSTAAGSDSMGAALDVYSMVKINKDKVPGLATVAERMSQYFKKAKANPSAKKQ